MKMHSIEYYDGETLLEGSYVYPETSEPRPAILVAHDWSGKNEFALEKAQQLAALGYIGFAIDMFGKGQLGETKEEKTALIQPLMQNRAALQNRIQAALATVRSLPQVIPDKIGAIGFCFGGLCVLDLARSGAEIKGVVSFHGLLQSADNLSHPKVIAKVLALHGYDDPMVTMDQVKLFADEMTRAQADWQLMMYGQTMHAFTNPKANDPDFGTVYNPRTAARAWREMQDFFKEIFSDKAV